MSIEIYQRIADFGKRLALLSTVEATLPAIAEEAKAIITAERCSIFMIDRDINMLWTKLSDGIGRIAIGLDSGIVGLCATSENPQISNHPYEDSRFMAKIDARGVKSFIMDNQDALVSAMKSAHRNSMR